MFYVNIDDTTDERLEFCGFVLIKEDEHHKLYRDYQGEEYIVSNAPPRYLRVEEYNDATCIGGTKAIEVSPRK